MSRRAKKKAKQNLLLIGIVVAVLGGGAYFLLNTPDEGGPSVSTNETIRVDVIPGQKLDGTIYNPEPPVKEDADVKEDVEDAENSETEDTVEEKEDVIEGHLEVHFVDVGQGDCSLICYIDDNLENGDDSAAMLVDAGDNSCGTLVRNYVSKHAPNGELEYFICTHPDADHIGGAASVVSNVKILSEKVWAPDFKKDSKTYDNLLNEVNNKWYSYEMPKLGYTYSLGKASFEFVAPTKDHTDVNSNSLVFKIWLGNDSFLFVGDCEEEEELEILSGKYVKDVNSDVLKVGHHGSKTATSEQFVFAVAPAYAVISCGEGNSYHHPHAGALNNLMANDVNLFRTDVQGTIVATSYGNGIKWNASPCDDWTPGE